MRHGSSNPVKHWPCERTATVQPLCSLTSNSSSVQGLEIMQEQNDVMSQVLRVPSGAWRGVDLHMRGHLFYNPSVKPVWCDVAHREGVTSFGGMWMLQSVTCYNQIECERGRRRWRGRCKRHACLHSWFQEELRRCSVCLTWVKWQDVNKRFGRPAFRDWLCNSKGEWCTVGDALLQPPHGRDSHGGCYGGCMCVIIQPKHGGQQTSQHPQIQTNEEAIEQKCPLSIYTGIIT